MAIWGAKASSLNTGSVPAIGTSVQRPFMLAHPEKFQHIPNLGNTSNLQAGDIFIVESNGRDEVGHTFIYLGESNPNYNQAAASGNTAMPHFGHVYFSDHRGTYDIFRVLPPGIDGATAQGQV
jgi:hypothetical protein